MDLNDCFKKMEEVKVEADLIFEKNNFYEKGFIKCNTFGNLLKPHRIFLLGINPGGNEENPEYDRNEVEFYRRNPDYNEFLVQDGRFINCLEKLYKNAFGEENLVDILSQTYYWNLCLSKSKKAYSKNKSIFMPVFNLYWDLFMRIVNIVRPDIILTFVEVKNFLENKLMRRFNCSQLIEDRNKYYYSLENVNLAGFNVRKIIAVNHVSRSFYSKEDWERVGHLLREDFEK